MDKIEDVIKFGIRARGQTERIRYLKSESLTRSESMLAHCYDCTGGYADGAKDCEMESCSMYGYMPYRKDKKRTIKERSEKQKEHDRKLSSFRSTDKQNNRLQGFIA